MSLWWSVGSVAVVLAVVAALALRSLNRRSAARFRAALIDAAFAGSLVLLAAVPLMLPVLVFRDPMGSPTAVHFTVPAVLSTIPSTLYFLGRDGFPGRQMRGRSLGKRSRHLRVARFDDRRMTLRRSIRRNITFLVVPLLAVPWTAPVAAAVLLVETLLAWRDPRGLRLGDRLAGTQVQYRSRHRSGPSSEDHEPGEAVTRAEVAS